MTTTLPKEVRQLLLLGFLYPVFSQSKTPGVSYGFKSIVAVSLLVFFQSLVQLLVSVVKTCLLILSRSQTLCFTSTNDHPIRSLCSRFLDFYTNITSTDIP